MILRKNMLRLGLAGVLLVAASVAAAQNGPNVASSSVQPTAVDSDADVATRVKAALHADTHVYDRASKRTGG